MPKLVTTEQQVRSRIRRKISYNEDKFRNGPQSQRRYRGTESGVEAVRRSNERAAGKQKSFRKALELVENEILHPSISSKRP